MGIRAFDTYLRASKLQTNAPLSALQNTRLGIDANNYIKLLLTEPPSREPLVAATGGLPIALASKIEADLRVLEKWFIKPVFVFGGLPLNSRGPTATGIGAVSPKGGAAPHFHFHHEGNMERENQIKAEAWMHYENNDVERTVMTLTSIKGGGAWSDVKDVLRLVLKVFRQRSVEYIIAPYMESAQLAYLLGHPRGYIHAIYGANEALLYPIDKLITTIDFTEGTFSFVEKGRVLHDLQITDEQFVDLGLLAGCSMSRTYQPLVPEFSWARTLELLKIHKSGVGVYQSWRDPKATHGGELFIKTRLAIKYGLVLTTEGETKPLPLAMLHQGVQPQDVPSDLDHIFSERLPDELYYLICRAWVSPAVIGWLSSGVIIENQPLHDSADYRRFIRDVVTEGHTSPRCTTLALLADVLHPQWKQKRVTAHYYFEPNHGPTSVSPIPFADYMTQTLVHKCKEWVVPTTVLEVELRRQNSSTLDLKLCIGALATEELAKKTIRDKKGGRIMEKKDETVANIIWRFLDVRGFINADHQQSLMGKALHAACSGSRVNDKFQESLYLVLELLRAGVLHGTRFSSNDPEPYSGGPNNGTEDEQRSTLLIMRTLSVLPLTFRPQQWVGPLSRELLVFNSFVRALTKSLRHLLEAVSVHFVLSGDARRNRDDYLDIVQSLPFQTDVNTGFGILAKTYIDATTVFNEDIITSEMAITEKAKEAKKEALAFIDTTFSTVKMPLQEVERGFRFWDTVMLAIRMLAREQGPKPSLANSVVQPNVIEQFEVADAFLRPIRP